MDEVKRTGRLMADVPLEWGPRHIAHKLAACVESQRITKGYVRIAFAHARGWLVFVTAAAEEWERLYERLDEWDNVSALEDAIAQLEIIRDQVKRYNKSGSIHDRPKLSLQIDVTVKQHVVVYFTAAVYHALRRRVHELRGGGESDAA